MSRPLQRGSSVRTPDKPRVADLSPQTPPKRNQEEQDEDRQRWRVTHDGVLSYLPHSIRLWIKQLFQDLSPPPLPPPLTGTPQKLVRSLENSLTPSSDDQSRNAFFSPKSASRTSHPSFWNPRSSPLPLPYTSPLSAAGVSRNNASNRSPCLSLSMVFLVLCLASAMVVLVVTTSWIQPPTAFSYPQGRYRSLKRAVLHELSFGGIMGLGTVRPREVAICGMGTENFVPCHNVTANEAAGLQNGEELQRHCELSTSSLLRCLIPPPKAYRLPLRWPDSQDTVWFHNVKRPEENLHGTAVRKMKRAMLVESSAQISFTGELAQITDDYSQQIAVMLGLDNDALFSQAGIQTVLDVGCCFGSLAAHFVSHNVITLTVDPYQIDGGNAQVALERGLPAVLGSLTSSRQLPVPSFAFDMVHCAIEFKSKDSITILEIDRILRPGGYFVWTSSPDQLQGVSGPELHDDEKVEKEIAELANRICWDIVSQRGKTTIWQKTSDSTCLKSRSRVIKPKVCVQGTYDPEFAWGQKQRPCLSEGPNARWRPVDKQAKWPNRLLVAPPEWAEVSAFGLAAEEVMDDVMHVESVTWKAVVKDYWTLLTPLIFSDNPKRPGDDDPLPPSNLVRNVLDMNAGYGDFNAALLFTGKPVWVMNVIPTTVTNTLPIIYDRGLVGILHDWCEAFPTYPRTYDLVHGAHLLSLEQHRARPCSLSLLFLEIDRILRPEGWVLLRDEAQLIEDARLAATQIRWEARIIEVTGKSDQRLLVCQKTFWKA